MSKIAFDAVSNGQMSGAGSSFSFSHVLGSSGTFPYLIVGVCAYALTVNAANLPISSITINGVALTKLTHTSIAATGGAKAGNTMRTEFWYLAAADMPPPGTYSIVITFTGSVIHALGGALSFYNLRPTTPDVSNTKNLTTGGGSQSISNDITNLAPDAVIIQIVGSGNEGTFTPDSSQTEEVDDKIAGGNAIQICYKIVTSLATYSIQSTHQNGEYLMEILATIPFFDSQAGQVF